MKKSITTNSEYYRMKNLCSSGFREFQRVNNHLIRALDLHIEYGKIIWQEILSQSRLFCKAERDLMVDVRLTIMDEHNQPLSSMSFFDFSQNSDSRFEHFKKMAA